MKKKINVFFVFLINLIYLEFLYRILIIRPIFRLSNVNMLLFLIPVSFFLALFTNLSKKEKVNRIVLAIFSFVLSFWFSAQYVLKDYFGCYLSIGAFGVADQIGSFAFKGVLETLRRIPGILLMFVPFILILVFHRFIDYKRSNRKQNILLVAGVIISYIVYLGGLQIDKKSTYSPYTLYYQVNDVNLNMERLGVTTSFFLDVKRVLFGFEEKIVLMDNPLEKEEEPEEEIEEEKPKVYAYNVLDIDFDSLIANEKNKTIKEMHEYFKQDPGTLQNEYTGMFKDKNLILFMAESFNEIAVSKELTPTLYKLVNSGFVFENFYTPTIYSTIGGEFQELTGLYAQSIDILKQFRTGNVSFPQGIATMFQKENYKTYAYHNNSYTFQSRNKYLPSLGFNNFIGCKNGMEKRINCNTWPQSDVDMIEKTVDDYIHQDKFMVFYATVSGHSSYDSFRSNASARKHQEEYESFNLPYSTRTATYLAAQMELDRALETLLKKLEEEGVLENTVIALVGDHYPYELSVKEVNEAASYQKDGDVEINHSNFILWNSEMETVKVSKVGSQIDVIPTIYNVFGLPYDSRLFIGRDILSTDGGLAIFASKSWVSDKGTYFASSNKFVLKEGEEVDDNYVKTMNQLVSNRVNMSRKIIMNNYYKKVLPS